MFFVSAIDTNAGFNINIDMAIKLIKEYRILTTIQQKEVIETLKTDLRPKNYGGSRINKRDFHNWHNKAVQTYYLLNQTVYFETRQEKLVLKTGKNSFVAPDKTRLNRSVNEKHLYFKEHNIQKKTIGFEPHHIIPLAWSENIHHFKIIDKWKNLIYIDAFSHAKITQNANKNVVLDILHEDMILSDYSKNKVYLRHSKNALYKIEMVKL